MGLRLEPATAHRGRAPNCAGQRPQPHTSVSACCSGGPRPARTAASLRRAFGQSTWRHAPIPSSSDRGRSLVAAALPAEQVFTTLQTAVSPQLAALVSSSIGASTSALQAAMESALVHSAVLLSFTSPVCFSQVGSRSARPERLRALQYCMRRSCYWRCRGLVGQAECHVHIC